ncbi:hypothetical protein [Salinibacterium sp.]|uniref:hypothetical protein n=1 Tax=Salinibacterium sp. TaxID=1915057 RepID=UPI00286B7FBB|nr:hypothetical protein [Salinibacterium sp.]
MIAPRLLAGEVRVRVGAVGVSALGTQVAGIIDGVGPDSAGFAKNDRVAFRSLAPTSAAIITVAERDLIGIPADVTLDAAAALFPCAMLARSVVKQVHAVGRGTRVALTDVSVVAPFVVAWAHHLGATVLSDAIAQLEASDVIISGRSVRTALGMRPGHGSVQQVASDVFAAMRSGAFDAISTSTAEQARQGSRSPVLLHPAEVSLAA